MYDPLVDQEAVLKEYSLNLVNGPVRESYDAIVLGVAHDSFKKMGAKKIRDFGKPNHILYDLKYCFAASESDGRL